MELNPKGKAASSPIGTHRGLDFGLHSLAPRQLTLLYLYKFVHAGLSSRVQWAVFSDLVSVLPADPVLSFPDPSDFISGTVTFAPSRYSSILGFQEQI